MRYLEGLSGSGELSCGGARIATATYDLDRFIRGTAGVVISGEIELAADDLNSVFGRTDVHLRTEGGVLLRLTFQAKKLVHGNGIAYVEATEDVAVAG